MWVVVGVPFDALVVWLLHAYPSGGLQGGPMGADHSEAGPIRAGLAVCVSTLARPPRGTWTGGHIESGPRNVDHHNIPMSETELSESTWSKSTRSKHMRRFPKTYCKTLCSTKQHKIVIFRHNIFRHKMHANRSPQSSALKNHMGL